MKPDDTDPHMRDTNPSDIRVTTPFDKVQLAPSIWERLAIPATLGLRMSHRGILAGELTIVGNTIWDRVRILHAAQCQGLEATITELTMLADALEARAEHYETSKR